MASAPPPTHKGWLSKQGGRIKTWKERYFILQDGTMTYEDSTGVRGSFSVVGQRCCPHPKHSNSFQVDTPLRTYVMKAKDSEEVEWWRAALLEHGGLWEEDVAGPALRRITPQSRKDSTKASEPRKGSEATAPKEEAAKGQHRDSNAREEIIEEKGDLFDGGFKGMVAVIEFEAEGIDVEFFVNDIPVGNVKKCGKGHFVPKDILKSGINEFSMLIGLLDKVRQFNTAKIYSKPVDGVVARMVFNLYNSIEEIGSQKGKEVLTVEWKGVGEQNLPFGLKKRRDLGKIMEAQHKWEQLPKLDLEDYQIRDEVFQFLKAYQRAVEYNDRPALLKLRKHVDDDEAVVDEQELQAMREDGFQPWTEESLILRSLADGKLVEPLRLSGKPAILTNESEYGCKQVPMLLGRYSGSITWIL